MPAHKYINISKEPCTNSSTSTYLGSYKNSPRFLDCLDYSTIIQSVLPLSPRFSWSNLVKDASKSRRKVARKTTGDRSVTLPSACFEVSYRTHSSDLISYALWKRWRSPLGLNIPFLPTLYRSPSAYWGDQQNLYSVMLFGDQQHVG